MPRDLRATYQGLLTRESTAGKDLAGLRVPGRAGLVPLSSVADLSVGSGPSQIDRYDRRRFVTVSADLGGAPLGQALAQACRTRARPIVMTTVAMIAGMMPIALGLGADASFRQPMATAVIGGLVTSTALSLLVVPVVFTYVHAFEGLFQRRGQAPAAHGAAPAAGVAT